MAAPQNVIFSTSDGVRLSGLHWDVGLRDLGCVVAHGFTGSSRDPHVQRICRSLASRGAGVLALDLRGHGRSGGRSTLGAAETLDVAAGVDWLRAHGYERVAALGWSMGGSAVLRYAGTRDASSSGADAVVSVSSPGRWFERGTRPMRLVHWVCEHPSGRLALRLARHTRVDPRLWPEVPSAPHEVVGAVAPTPLLIVHGDADHYFPMSHVEALRAAAPPADVWIEHGMGHAEHATTDELLGRISRWLLAVTPSTGTSAGNRQVCDDGRRD